ncbi:MAG TPA: toxin C-terminal domain-containing protein, partial [Kofleriaceae bacterium]|nr:toxin C-terminal domain-containing protein [Kofleriaceae bacterium]
TFTPTKPGPYRDTMFVDTTMGPDVGIRVQGYGIARLYEAVADGDQHAIEELDEVLEADRVADAQRAAHGVAPPRVETYAELDTAFAQAIDFAKRKMWPEATVLAEAVGDRMRTITDPQRLLDMSRRFGVGQHGLEVEIVMARAAVFDLEQRTESKQAVDGEPYLNAFEQAGPDLRVLTGESDDVSHLRGLDRATWVTVELVAAPLAAVGVVATGGLLLEASPAIVAEIEFVGYAGRSLFAALAVWINTHPEEAEAWAEVALSVGVDAGEDPHAFYENIQTRQGWMQLAMNVFMTVYPARAGRGGAAGDDAGEPASTAPRGTAGRGPTVDSPASPGSAAARPASPRTTDPEVEAAAVTTRDRLMGFARTVRQRSRTQGAGDSSHEQGSTANGSPLSSGRSSGNTPEPVSEPRVPRSPEEPHVSIEREVQLGDAVHHLRVRKRADGESVLTLCSDCANVREAIAKVLADAPTKGPGKALSARLTRLQARVASLEEGLANNTIKHTDAVRELNQIAAHLRDAYRKLPNADGLCIFCNFEARLDYDALARSLGFERTRERAHGQPVYRRGNEFISADADQHNGGIWKKATGSADNLRNRDTRDGTFNEDLTEQVGP